MKKNKFPKHGYHFVRQCKQCGKVYPKECPKYCKKCGTRLLLDQDEEGISYYSENVLFQVAVRTWYGKYKVEDWIFKTREE